MHNIWLRYVLLPAGVYLGLRFLFVPLLPFLIALGLSVLMEPWVQKCRKRLGFRRDFTAAALTTLLLLGIAVGVYALLGKLLSQAIACLDYLPQLLQRLPYLLDDLEARYSGLYHACPLEIRQWLDGALENLSQEGLSLVSDLSGKLLAWVSSLLGKLPGILLFLATTVLAAYFTAASYPGLIAFIRRQLPRRWQGTLSAAAQTMRSTFWKWLKAESLLCLITFCLLLAGFLYLRIDYALLSAVLVAIVDALPVLGTGTVLIPWAIYHLLLGTFPRGIALLALYAIILLVRSLMEPKVMAAQAGLPPLSALLAMYLGYCLFGIWGMLLLPVLLLFVKQLQDSGAIHLWK